MSMVQFYTVNPAHPLSGNARNRQPQPMMAPCLEASTDRVQQQQTAQMPLSMSVCHTVGVLAAHTLLFTRAGRLRHEVNVVRYVKVSPCWPFQGEHCLWLKAAAVAKLALVSMLSVPGTLPLAMQVEKVEKVEKVTGKYTVMGSIRRVLLQSHALSCFDHQEQQRQVYCSSQ